MAAWERRGPSDVPTEGWYGGPLCLYYNPKDRRIFIPRSRHRFRGHSLNLARPGSWLLIAASGLLPLAGVILVLWLRQSGALP